MIDGRSQVAPDGEGEGGLEFGIPVHPNVPHQAVHHQLHHLQPGGGGGVGGEGGHLKCAEVLQA